MKILPVILILLNSFSSMVNAAMNVWNTDTRTLTFTMQDGKPWLIEGNAQIRFTGGSCIGAHGRRKDSIPQ